MVNDLTINYLKLKMSDFLFSDSNEFPSQDQNDLLNETFPSSPFLENNVKSFSDISGDSNHSDIIQQLIYSDFDQNDLENHLVNDLENTSGIKNEYLLELLRIIINHNAEFSLMDSILKLNKRFNFTNTLSHKTIINWIEPFLIKSNIIFECECGEIYFYQKEDNKCDYFCSKCDKYKNVNNFIKSNVTVTNFSIKEQLISISENFDQLDGLSSDTNEEFIIKLSLGLDEVPLTESSQLGLVPLFCFINNIKNLGLRYSYYMIKSISLIDKTKIKPILIDQLNQKTKKIKKERLKVNYDLMLKPLIEELNSLTTFETKWSKKTRLKVDMFIADSVCRAPVLKMKNHNSIQPCFRDLVEHHPKKPFQLLKSTELNAKNRRTKESIIKDSESESNCVIGISLLLSYLNNFTFDFVSNSIVEWMHVVELGFCKNYLKRLLKDVGRDYYLNPSKKEQVNSRLRSLILPSSFTRGSRSLEFIADFKALDFKVILFYTCKFL